MVSKKSRKKLRAFAIIIICLNIIIYLSFNFYVNNKNEFHYNKALLSEKLVPNNRDLSENEEKETYDNPDYIRKYFDIWFKGYGKITPELMKSWSMEKEKLPEDNSTTNFWIQWGPVGQYIPGRNHRVQHADRCFEPGATWHGCG